MTQEATITKVKPTKLEVLKGDLSHHQRALESFFEGEEMAKKFLASSLYLAEKIPKLLDCDRWSFINSLICCAEVWLFPWVSGQVYILPYWNSKKKCNEAQFQLGYQWLVTLLYRSWITTIYSDIVMKNDDCKVAWWTNPWITHSIALWARWEAIWAYVVATLNWEKVFKYMSKEDILEFKEFSQSANAQEQWQRDKSPWNPKNDPQLNMWKKTVLKQLTKLLPKNEKITRALKEDDKEGDIKKYVESKQEKLESPQEAVDKFTKKKKELSEKKVVDDPKELLKAKQDYVVVTWAQPAKEDTIASLKVKETNFIKQLEKQQW